MQRSTLRRTACAAAVALGLGFGVREVAAVPASEQARPYCEDDFDCQNTCDLIYGVDKRSGFCSDGNTCYCY